MKTFFKTEEQSKQLAEIMKDVRRQVKNYEKAKKAGTLKEIPYIKSNNPI